MPSDAARIEIATRYLPERDLTGKIIGAFFDTYNELGFGFLESIYRTALGIVLMERGHTVESEKPFDVSFRGRIVGSHRTDLIIDKRVLLELKAGAAVPPGAREQLTNYLRITQIQVGLILFFGPEPRFKRVVCTNRQQDQTLSAPPR